MMARDVEAIAIGGRRMRSSVGKQVCHRSPPLAYGGRHRNTVRPGGTNGAGNYSKKRFCLESRRQSTLEAAQWATGERSTHTRAFIAWSMGRPSGPHFLSFGCAGVPGTLWADIRRHKFCGIVWMSPTMQRIGGGQLERKAGTQAWHQTQAMLN
jgi:hypothetical protein